MSGDSFDIICPHCRAAVPVDSERCPECETELTARPRRVSAASPSPAPIAAPAGPAAPGAAALAVQQRIEGITTVPVLPTFTRGFARSSYAGFWIRFFASLIDGVLVFLAVVFLALLGQGGEIAFSIVGVVGQLLYFPLMEASRHQGTIGKILLGLAVTDEAGRRISVPRAFGRYFGKLLSSLTFGIGYLLVAFTERKQGLHDIVAGTVVLHRSAF